MSALKNWCRQRDLNSQPSHYKWVALPIELCRHKTYLRFVRVLLFLALYVSNVASQLEQISLILFIELFVASPSIWSAINKIGFPNQWVFPQISHLCPYFSIKYFLAFLRALNSFIPFIWKLFCCSIICISCFHW